MKAINMCILIHWHYSFSSILRLRFLKKAVTKHKKTDHFWCVLNAILSYTCVFYKIRQCLLRLDAFWPDSLNLLQKLSWYLQHFRFFQELEINRNDFQDPTYKSDNLRVVYPAKWWEIQNGCVKAYNKHPW